jgi:hypothetical protein
MTRCLGVTTVSPAIGGEGTNDSPVHRVVSQDAALCYNLVSSWFGKV